MFHRSEAEVKDTSGLAGLRSLCATDISLILMSSKKKITNKRDLLVFLQPQILDPGDAEETDETPIENIITNNYFIGNMNENA